MRFVAVQEPTDSWAVFDTANDEPAEYAGRVLIGLTSCEALRFIEAANDQAGWPEDRGETARSGRLLVQ